jgi:hypothetical protein
VIGLPLRSFRPSFLALGATAWGELWPPEQSASILLSMVSEQLLFTV